MRYVPFRPELEGGTSPSSITPGSFVRFFVQCLRDDASNQELLRSSRSADVEYVSELAID